MADENDRAENQGPSLGGLFYRIHHGQQQRQKVGKADLLFGIPLFGGLAVGGVHQLWTGFQAGSLYLGRGSEASLADNPLGFYFSASIHLLIIAGCSNMVRVIFAHYWRKRQISLSRD